MHKPASLAVALAAVVVTSAVTSTVTSTAAAEPEGAASAPRVSGAQRHRTRAPKRTAQVHPRGRAPARHDANEATEEAPKQANDDATEASEAKAQQRGQNKPCTKPSVEIVALREADTFMLTNCDGRAALYAAERLGILARPGGAAKPTRPLAQLVRSRDPMLGPGVRRMDYGLVERLQKVADHFGRPGKTTKIFLVSGYRPSSSGSYHATARAMDFKVDGVTNEALVAFCKTLQDTGCGYYPNSTFVHMDARDRGAGHVSWIDASGPGEAPRYVDTWPPPEQRQARRPPAGDGETVRRADRELPPLPNDEHPALPAPRPHATDAADADDDGGH